MHGQTHVMFVITKLIKWFAVTKLKNNREFTTYSKGVLLGTYSKFSKTTQNVVASTQSFSQVNNPHLKQTLTSKSSSCSIS